METPTRLFRTVTRWSLYLLFFLVPIFFLPWTTELFEINKQIVLVILSSLATVAWLGEMVLGKRFTFRTGWLNVMPVVFLVLVLISSFFSLAGYQTWVGQASQEYTSFLSIASFVLLFYVLMHTAGDTKVQIKMLAALMLSALLTGLLTVFGMFDLYHLPFEFAQNKGFNTVGTINGLAVFLMLVMFLGLAMWTGSLHGEKTLIPEGRVGLIARVLIVLNSILALLVLVAVDFWVFWVISIIGVVILVAFYLLQSKKLPTPKQFVLPIVVFVISLILVFFPTPIRLKLPVVVTPSYGASWSITKQVLGVNTTRLLLGSGPGTFAYDYSRFKPAGVNNTLFWNVRFDRSKSHALTMLSTVGLLGSLAALVFVAFLGLKALGRLLLERDHEEWQMTFVLFTGWTLLSLVHLIYSSNFTLHFLFWAFSGLLASQVVGKMWSKGFAEAKKLGLVFSFAFVVLAVGVLASVFISEQRYSAELAFAKAVKIDSSGGELSDVIKELVKATDKNGLSDIYYRNLSTALLLQAGRVLQEAGAEPSEEQSQRVTQLVGASVNAAKTATDIEPNNVSNWSARGAIYRDVMPFVSNAEDFAAVTFQQAAQLEPVNPIHYTNLGRVHLVVAQRAAALKQAEDEELKKQAAESEVQQLNAAAQVFNAAVQLKPDYAPAHYYLAVAFERAGNIEAAANRLALLTQQNPTDVGLGFELGILLLRLQKLDLAKVSFERILNLSPNYSNAMWFLASVHELQKNSDEAIKLVEKVLELNPENELVSKRLARMKAGELTTVLPKPIEEGEVSATKVEGGPIETDEEPEDDEDLEEIIEESEE